MKRLPILFIVVCFAISFTSQSRADIDANEIYKIGTNDIIEITVLDHDDLRMMATVSSDGTITFPYIGTVMVKGLGTLEIEEEITERLKAGYIKYPVVTVSLVKSMSRKIYTFGPFNRRGEIPYDDNMTLLRAMSLSGGVSNDGLFGKISVRRKLADDSNEYKDLFERGLNNGFIDDQQIENMLLMPDDMLIVERNKTFLIEGEVAQRGRFVLENDMTVLRALLQAGGISQDGSYGRLMVRRKQKEKSGGYEEIAESIINDKAIESTEVEEMVLQPDDILIVESNETFLIQGEAAKRGRFVLEKDMTVLRALLQAGGTSENGRYGRIKVRRKDKEKQGGYEDIADAKINDGVIESSEVEDIILQPDDILIVERNKTFFIYGEAARTGEFVLENDMTVFKALNIAGGFTKWGSESRVKILRKTDNGEGFVKMEVNIDDIIDGDASADIILYPGDIIVASPGIF